jgi:hypothetical protein
MEDSERYARYTRPGGEGPELSLLLQAMVEDAKAYFDTQRDLVTLNASEKGGRMIAVMLLVLVVSVLLGGVLVMLSVALAIWLGGLLGNLAHGFLAVGGIHLLLAGLFVVLWKSVLREKLIISFINAVHGKD